MSSAYGLAGHRHLPEIAQEIEAAAVAGGHPVDGDLRITFVPASYAYDARHFVNLVCGFKA